jgi:signal transduction histidine kinase
MSRLKLWLLSLSLLATAAQGGVSWAWLNDEIPEIRDQQTLLQARLLSLPPSPAPQTCVQAGFHSGFAPEASTVRWVQVDLGQEYTLDSVVAVPASLGGTGPYGFPHHFRVDASNDALFAESTTLLDHSRGQTSAETSLSPWHMPARGVKARYVRFTATQLAGQPRLEKRYIFCLGELLVFSGNRNVALHAEVFAPNSVETLPTWSPKHLVDGYHALGLPVWPDNVQGNGWHSAIFTTADATSWVQADVGSAHEVQEIRLIPSHPRDYPDRPGFGLPPRFKVEADDRLIFDSTGTDFPNPGNMPVVISTPGLRVQTIRITATRLFERSSDFVFSLAELQAFAEGGQNIALGATVTSSDETLTPSWSHAGLVDGRSSSGRLVDEAAWLEGLFQRREVNAQLQMLEARMMMAFYLAEARTFYLLLASSVILLVGGFLLFLLLRRSRRLDMEALRHRISRDLHDEIGSHLGSIRLMSELALRDSSSHSESLEEIHRLAGEAAESMRGIIWLVREGDSPRLSSLAEAMRQSAAVLLKGTQWTLQAPSDDTTTTASLEFHRQVFLFFREAVHNIARHARATRATFELEWSARHFTLHIRDNGIGFDSSAVSTGNGLANLRHRADVLKGRLSIESSRGQGTHIILESPLG